MIWRTICIGIVITASTVQVSAEDWPRYRGPTADGHSSAKNLLTTWGPNKNVQWKTKLPGKAWSSPVIVDGKIYLTNAVPKGQNQSLRALCLDAKSGKLLWDEEVFQHPTRVTRVHTKNSHASPSAVVDDERVIVHFGHQGTACLDLKGKLIWKTNRYQYRPVHGNGGTPILVGDVLIFSCDGARSNFVVGLDKKTGKELWKTLRPTDASRRFSFSTPTLITVDGQQQVVSPGSNVVCAYDPKTGKELWRVSYNNQGYSVIPKPVFGQGLVFVCTGYNSPELLAIRPTAKGQATVVWRRKRVAPHTPSLLLVGTELFMVSDSGLASCLDAKTGKVHWTNKRLERGYSASPIYADGKIYFLSESGVGTVIAASKQFKQIAKNDLQERTLASYAVADGSLFVRTERGLYRFSEK